MGVDIVPLPKVFHHVLQFRVLSLGLHLVETPLCPDLIAGSHEYLDLGVREHRRADVPAVHHDSFPLSESVQTLIDIFPDKRDRRDRTDVAGHLQRADLLFYASVSDECSLGLEIQPQIR